MFAGIFGRFLEDLLEGDPVALAVAGALAVVALALLLFWWKTARDLRREDERKKQRYGRKDPRPGKERK